LNDREYRQAQRLVEKAMRKWVPLLGLQDWAINLQVSRQPFVGEYTGAAASCSAHWPYQSASITFSAPDVHEQPEKVEEWMVHELVHCLLEEMQHEGDEHIEHVTTAFTRIICRLGGV
jgi:hypothetical protein